MAKPSDTPMCFPALPCPPGRADGSKEAPTHYLAAVSCPVVQRQPGRFGLFGDEKPQSLLVSWVGTAGGVGILTALCLGIMDNRSVGVFDGSGQKML